MRAARALWIVAVAVVSAAICAAQSPPPPDMITKAGVFRQGFLWVLDVNGDGQMVLPPDRAYAFGGISGDIPLTGIWCTSLSPTCANPTYTTAGIFRAANGLFILDTLNNGTAGTVYYNFFTSPLSYQAGDIPVAGDWSGTGTTKVGIYRPSTGAWYLDYNGDGVFDAGDKTYQFGGITGDVPATGDWSGGGTTKIGIFRQGFLWVLDSNGDGVMDAGDIPAFGFGGVAGDVPVAGDWNGTGLAKAGVVRPFSPATPPALWILDANNDHVIDAGDLAFGYGGIAGDVPVVGKWSPELNVPPSTPNTLSVNGVPCNGGSCGQAAAGTTSTLVFTYNDPVNGSNNIAWGQAWLADSAGNPHCNLLWAPNGALKLYAEGSSSQFTAATSLNTTLSNTFCSVSVTQVSFVSSTSFSITLNMGFTSGVAGTYNVVSDVLGVCRNENFSNAESITYGRPSVDDGL